MDSTTAEYLESIREDFTQAVITATNARIDSHFHYLRTHLQTVMGDFATQDQLTSIVARAVETAATVAAASVEPIKSAQEAWQEEQRQKLDSFISEVKLRLDGFAPATAVETLRASFEDNRRHFDSVTGGHGEALASLKERVATLETSTNKSIDSIRNDTKSIKDNAQLMQNTLAEAIERDEKHRTETNRDIDGLKIDRAHTSNDIRELQQQVNKHHTTINDQKTWIIETLNPMELVIMGDKETGTAGITAQLSDLKAQQNGLSLRQQAIENGLSAFTTFINNPVGKALIIAFMVGNIVSVLAQIAN